MSTVTSRVSPYLLMIVLALAAIPHKAFAQINATAPGSQGCSAAGLGTTGCISSPQLAYDGSPMTAASISPALVAGNAFLRVGFAQPVLQGTTVTVRIGFTSAQAVNLALIVNATITTYTGPDAGAVVQTVPISATVTPNMPIDISFTAETTFQYVQLSASSVVNASNTYTALFYNAAIPSPLPVELVTFTGKSHADAVELNWVTASEKNSAYFIVERATGAQNQYKRLSEVAGAGNSTRATNYRFVDAQPVGLGYYRLRQVDLDGTSTYSPAVAVRSTPALVLLAYPNPSTGLLTVAGPPHTRFTIVNRLGQVVQRGEMGVANTSQVDLRGLPASVYFLREEATGAVVKIAIAGTDASQ